MLVNFLDGVAHGYISAVYARPDGPVRCNQGPQSLMKISCDKALLEPLRNGFALCITRSRGPQGYHLITREVGGSIDGWKVEDFLVKRLRSPQGNCYEDVGLMT